MKKLIFSALLLLNFSVFSGEGEDVNECFTKATERLHEKIFLGQENYFKYVEELKVCQNQDEDEYLGKDYNDCVKEASRSYKDERSECRGMTNSNERKECYKSARETHAESRASCERVNHSDNNKNIKSIFGK